MNEDRHPVRKFLIIVLTSLMALSAHAWESTTVEAPPEDTSLQATYGNALVTIGSVPAPASVIELARYSSEGTGIRPTNKPKLAKVVTKSVLSRSAREQMVLASTTGKPFDRAASIAANDEDDDEGLDDQDLHRSYRQPQLAKLADQVADGDEAAIDLPEHVKLRLWMARTKAVEAHALNQLSKAEGPADAALSETVKLRLFLGRARALKAHSEKFRDIA